MSAEKRDSKRRCASKKAYYERHKERLREEARRRAAQKRDEGTKVAQRQCQKDYRERNAWILQLRRLNRYRKIYIQENGVQAFRERFVSRLSRSSRQAIPKGYLLEDHDDEVLEPIYTYYHHPPPL
ncbi:uncharacterized protein SCHCODRAFT_02706233 [Schizophyllum commune H4-8]|nr:uncharacterized protein SCHCODRAFT_02706233 [Schizophyllum commune H4-8]KAI5885769.1 hypothetical protein SCHCODRAFT_02706233 [Schizophyllum commune H4-8]